MRSDVSDGGRTDVQTRIIQVDPVHPDPERIAIAAVALRRDGLVAFPTETVYGLGANALSTTAVQAIFAAKGRPADNPLIVHIADPDMLSPLVVYPAPAIREAARRAMRAFWPGPLTLVLPRRSGVPDAVTAGLDTVAVRMPRHQVALDLILAAGQPLAAPSANRSGGPSPTLAEHVADDLSGRIDIILDGGPTGVGIESTVLDLTAIVPTVLRPGGITVEMLREVVDRVEVDPAALGEEALGEARSPGMRYSHYAPRALAVLVEGEPAAVAEQVQVLVDEHAAAGRRVGILATRESAAVLRADVVQSPGSRYVPVSYAENLFRCLRELDRAGVDVIVMEGVPLPGLGLGIMNRLRRAATTRIVAGKGGGP